jgi:diguanylate cyclase (GGDEF)-like protein
LRTQSLRDELTGVFNRRGFLAHAEQQSLTALRSRKPFDIVFIDMDGMKRINDTLGHPAGDTALCETVEILRETFRESDVIGRLGGDEFAVLVLDSGEAEIALVMERLKEKLATHNTRDGREFSLSLSLGISRFNPLQPVAIEELIEAADRRMYEAKRAKGAARSA